METGTHLGLGSCIIAAALLRNGHGRLTTIDVDADAGYLITEPWASVIDRRIGSSVDELASLRDVGMFLHDSLHTYEYETSELAAVEPNLRPTPSSSPTTPTTHLHCPIGPNGPDVITCSSRSSRATTGGRATASGPRGQDNALKVPILTGAGSSCPVTRS